MNQQKGSFQVKVSPHTVSSMLFGFLGQLHTFSTLELGLLGLLGSYTLSAP